MKLSKTLEQGKEMMFFYEKIGMGTILTFDWDVLYKPISKTELLENVRYLNDVKYKEILIYMDLFSKSNNDAKFIAALTLFLANLFNFDILIDEINSKSNFNDSSLNQTVNEFLKKSKFTMQFDLFINQEKYKLEISKHINRLSQQLFNRLMIDFYYDRTKNLSQSTVLFVDIFKPELFYRINEHIQAIIFRKPFNNKDQLKLLSKEFQIPIVYAPIKLNQCDYVIIDSPKSLLLINPSADEIDFYDTLVQSSRYNIGDVPLYPVSKVEIYAPLVNKNHIPLIMNSHWYQGIAPYKTEYMFLVRGRALTFKEQYEEMKEIFELVKEKPFYLRLPDFRDEKRIDHLEDIYTDMDSYLENVYFFDEHLDAIALAAKDSGIKLNILVPMIRLPEELVFWKNRIESSFANIKLEVPGIGMVVETESAYEYFEDYPFEKFSMVGLNDLIEEISYNYNRFSKIDLKKFEELFIPELKELHQHYRRRHKVTKHIVDGTFLEEPTILKKLLKYGFTNFTIQLDKIKSLENDIASYAASRGRYIGVAEERKRKRMQKEAMK